MSNYKQEAATYSQNINGLQLAINEIKSSLDDVISKIAKEEDSSLKNNVTEKVNSIKNALDSIISDSSSNVSKITAKANELDEINKPKEDEKKEEEKKEKEELNGEIPQNEEIN